MTITDINAEARALCDANSVSYTDADLLRRVNAAYEEIIGKIIGSDRTWQFGDSNYSSLPTGLQNLVADQQPYPFDSAQLNIIRVEVKDANGIWHTLNPIDWSGIDFALPEYQKVSGLPLEYAKRENFLLLFPAAAADKVTLSNGLKVYFQRTADLFTSGQVSTGTKTPGFASPFHVLLAYKAAIPYCMSFKKDRVAPLTAKVIEIERDLLAFYSRRERDVPPVMTTKPIRFR